MDGGLNEAASVLREAQARIARALLGGSARRIEPRLGELVLRPHQVSAVGRLLDLIASHRGALLADAVGLGKTYVALAVAREYPTALVICPAALRGMWERAMGVAHATHPMVTIESLSRGKVPANNFDLLIVDEAHHLRTPGTRRYQAVAHLARRSRVLLLSATPLHNARRDLTSVLALFAGGCVERWSDSALARLVVRRDDATAGQSLPAVEGPHAISIGDADDCLDAILALPPAVPAADEGVAHALTIFSLIHLWASSRAALLASMQKRLARATALRDAVAAGHMPTASELAAWAYADGSMQLAFPLFQPSDRSIDQRGLNEQLDRFIEGASALLARCRRPPDPDDARVRLLRSLRRQHPGERIVAFSQYAHTIGGIGRRMRNDAGIAVVTAGGARIASGSIPREEVVSQFGVPAPWVRPAERIDLLLTTDLLSEGIDLRGASVIVHIDLPWNPARMEQRVGRSRRLGSPFAEVHVYTFVPPTTAERFIDLRRRLADKVKAARAIVGGGFDPFGQGEMISSPVGAGEALRARLSSWLLEDDPSDEATVVAAASAAIHGWIAVVTLGGVARMIGDVGQGITDDAAMLEPAVAQVGMSVFVDEPRRNVTLASIRGWIASRRASAGAEQQSPAKRAVLDRLAQAVARAPRHRRASLVGTAQRARRALSGATGVGTERLLSELARSLADDVTWLQSVDALEILHTDEPADSRAEDAIVAVILLEPIIESGRATPV
jgi:superfamily II DNA or RNA helicase